MPKLLIADHSEIRRDSLKETLQTEWEIHACIDSYPVIDTLKYTNPDALIIDLNIGPQDGLSILRDCFPDLPPVILALTNFTSPYIIKTSESLGVGFLMRTPCKISYIKERLEDMYKAYLDDSSLLKRHLHALGISNNLSGYRCLLTAIPFFQVNPNLMIKEVYPEVAKSCNLTDKNNVEHCIRTAIRNAWKYRDPNVWEYYFPGCTKCPSNKKFITRLAELL